MTDQSRRKELKENYRQTPREAGVYRFVNGQTGQMFIGTSADLNSVRGKLSYAQATGAGSIFDRRMRPAVTQYGVASFTLEILEIFEPTPEMTRADILRDLAVLEELHREQYDPALLY